MTIRSATEVRTAEDKADYVYISHAFCEMITWATSSSDSEAEEEEEEVKEEVSSSNEELLRSPHARV
ncbi:unnamed protein product [Soboliphyme baturini]|uniref:Uncharacterized protein n=1 Tax=Soboliphyme baturini TaxID=241478 RepID=A0A183J4W4_9BILA|nr:unnamed protein product [Soboliphyme baturini]